MLKRPGAHRLDLVECSSIISCIRLNMPLVLGAHKFDQVLAAAASISSHCTFQIEFQFDIRYHRSSCILLLRNTDSIRHVCTIYSFDRIRKKNLLMSRQHLSKRARSIDYSAVVRSCSKMITQPTAKQRQVFAGQGESSRTQSQASIKISSEFSGQESEPPT